MQNFVLILLICSLTMSALALLYMSAMPLLAKHYSEKGRYYAWLIIMVGLIIPFRPQWNNTLFSVETPSNTSSIVQASSDTPIRFFPPITFHNIDLQPMDNIAISNSAADSTATLLFTALSVWQILGAIWLAGVIVFIAYHSIKHLRFTKMTCRWGKNVTDVHVLSLLESLTSDMGIARQIPVYICPCVGSPMMVGLIKPRILLPRLHGRAASKGSDQPTLELSQDELCFILKHELVHYKRKDLLYKYLVLTATALHWFNPIVCLIAKAVSVQCETSCDAEVLQSADIDTRRLYGETIIGVVKYQAKRKTILSTNFYGGKQGMSKRISSIMDMRKKKAGVLLFCIVLVFAMSTSFFVAAYASNMEIYHDENRPMFYAILQPEPLCDYAPTQPLDEYNNAFVMPAYVNEAHDNVPLYTDTNLSQMQEEDTRVVYDATYVHDGYTPIPLCDWEIENTIYVKVVDRTNKEQLIYVKRDGQWVFCEERTYNLAQNPYRS